MIGVRGVAETAVQRKLSGVLPYGGVAAGPLPSTARLRSTSARSPVNTRPGRFDQRGEAAKMSSPAGLRNAGRATWPTPASALGRGHEELTGVQLGRQLLHRTVRRGGRCGCTQVAQQFAATEAEETGEQDQAPVAGRRRVREG